MLQQGDRVRIIGHADCKYVLHPSWIGKEGILSVYMESVGFWNVTVEGEEIYCMEQELEKIS